MLVLLSDSLRLIDDFIQIEVRSTTKMILADFGVFYFPLNWSLLNEYLLRLYFSPLVKDSFLLSILKKTLYLFYLLLSDICICLNAHFVDWC